jgi:hypothetical protein
MTCAVCLLVEQVEKSVARAEPHSYVLGHESDRPDVDRLACWGCEQGRVVAASFT